MPVTDLMANGMHQDVVLAVCVCKTNMRQTIEHLTYNAAN